jgi:Reverse transcriptase (RNA-dependent DNA polymerase)
MITEFLNCEEKKAWVIVPKSKVPKGRKIIGNRWVYAEKDDGTFRSRTVAKGVSQIPGKDFQEHHSPVVHDTIFRVVLVQKLVYNLHSRQFDSVTAFLLD